MYQLPCNNSPSIRKTEPTESTDTYDLWLTSVTSTLPSWLDFLSMNPQHHTTEFGCEDYRP